MRTAEWLAEHFEDHSPMKRRFAILIAAVLFCACPSMGAHDHWVVHRFPEQSVAAIRSFIQQPLHPRRTRIQEGS
jgi:hypothetical protein